MNSNESSEENICFSMNQSSDENDVSDSHYNLELNKSLHEHLKENYPEVLNVISALRKLIKKQKKIIKKLKLKFKESNLCKDVSTQTDAEGLPIEINSDTSTRLCEDITNAAESAMHKMGFVYEETSGLYYDYNSGYYYNAELGLYYDGNTGTYMTYDSETQSFLFHSQVDTVPNESISVVRRPEEKYEHHKRKKKDRTRSKVIISADMENLAQSFNRINITPLRKLAFEVSQAWPPCMRIIVKTTMVPQLKEGSLFIITYEGGTLGREGNHSIVIPDINISKHHLKFDFNKDSDKYTVTDLGSRNGTLLNQKRISASKQESDPIKIEHGSQIQIGSTILLCHIHCGNTTCGHCEPGLVQTVTDAIGNSSKLTKNEQHKSELRKLRKKFGIGWTDTNNVQLATGYTDRAQVRRALVGSQNEHEKTQVASLDLSIGSDNKGFKLLSKMGWSEGKALGKEGTGLLNPVDVISTTGTRGIGYKGEDTKNITNLGSSNIWEKTQKRYQQLDLPAESDNLD